jgi:carbon storage regulator CsrA
MLVLTRKAGQQIRIGDQITLTIVKTQGQTVRVGIEAPREVRVVRAELPPLGDVEAPAASTTAADVKDANTIALHAIHATRADRRPGHDAQNTPRREQLSHPHRWTVTNMRERVEGLGTTNRPTDSKRRVQHV